MIRPLSAVAVGLLLFGLVLVTGPAAAGHFCDYKSMPATAPASRFTDNGDGTVTDKVTGLHWKRCSEGQTWDGTTCTGTATAYTWQQAMDLAEAASYAGKSDWRLPSIEELRSIVEQACIEPAIDLTVFPATPSVGWWSSSPYAGYAGQAWTIFFYDGKDANNNKDSGNCRVRLVRQQ